MEEMSGNQRTAIVIDTIPIRIIGEPKFGMLNDPAVVGETFYML
jgi:hypothetical protein